MTARSTPSGPALVPRRTLLDKLAAIDHPAQKPAPMRAEWALSATARDAARSGESSVRRKISRLPACLTSQWRRHSFSAPRGDKPQRWAN